MNKDYQFWHKLKTYINNASYRVKFKEGDVWFCRLGMNIGSEQDGKGEHFLRPILVLKKFNSQVFLAIPLTKTAKTGRFYYSFQLKDSVASTAILSQIRLVDAKRLKYQIGRLNKENMFQIKQKLKQLLE